jgi:hypothetical protein
MNMIYVLLFCSHCCIFYVLLRCSHFHTHCHTAHYLYTSQLFQDWRDDVERLLGDKDSPLVLETQGRLMELDVRNDGRLKVHYSERLVTLLRETRQLGELGYVIPRKVRDAVAAGDTFYRYGLQLRQVANFYNAMVSNAMPCDAFSCCALYVMPYT